MSTGGGKNSNKRQKLISPTCSLLDNSTGSISGSPTSVPTANDQQNNDQAKGSKVVVIVGGVIGDLGFLAAAGAGAWVFFRKHKKIKGVESESGSGPCAFGQFLLYLVSTNADLNKKTTGVRMRRLLQ